MEILVAYDVSTITPAGEKRLRKVAKICEGYGQRVQYSVFECTLSDVHLEALVHRLKAVIVEEEDSIRIYRLLEPRRRYVQTIGRAPLFSFGDPLIV